MNDGSAEATRPTLSVIVPNYNHAQYLPVSLQAILAQDRPADEIIVIDDASSDGSVALVETIAARHASVKLLRNELNRGVIATLQRGLEAARGSLVYFAAADDQVLPGFFSLALDALARHPDAGFFCADTSIVEGGSGRPLGSRPVVRPALRAAAFSAAETARLFRSADNFIHTGSAIFRRDLVVGKGGFDARAGSFCDGILARKIAFSYGFCYAPRPVSAWNVFPNGVSRTTALDLNNAIAALETIPALLSADPDFPDWYPALFRRRWRFGTARLALGREDPDPETVIAMGSRGRLDRMVLTALSTRPKSSIARALALVWLTVRLRPFRLVDVALSALSRRIGSDKKPAVARVMPPDAPP